MTALSPGASPQTAALERRWQAPFTVDVMGVLAPHRRGRGDPAFVVDEAGAIWRACRTPEGAGTLRMAARSIPVGPGRVTVADAMAWGPGAAWLLDSLPSLLGGA